jgi:hypothetical protein
MVTSNAITSTQPRRPDPVIHPIIELMPLSIMVASFKEIRACLLQCDIGCLRSFRGVAFRLGNGPKGGTSDRTERPAGLRYNRAPCRRPS